MSAPMMRKSAPANPNAAAQEALAQNNAKGADVYYGEKNSGIRLVSTGKLDEDAEAARKALIRSMGKKPQNSLADRWSAPKVKSQDEVLEEVGDRRISSSHKEYEKRRMSRIEERRAELEKLARDKENEEKERLERIEKRRLERLSSSGSKTSDISDRINRLSMGDDGALTTEKSTSIPSYRSSAPQVTSLYNKDNFPRLSHR